MKFDKASVRETIDKAKILLNQEEGLSPALKSIIEMLICFVQVFVGRLSVNSKNSSKPPSYDKNRKRSGRKKSKKKAGGQEGYQGTRLEKVDHPDEIKNIAIDRRELPKGKYIAAGFEARQVIDFKISRVVTEYRAEVLEDGNGTQYVGAQRRNCAKITFTNINPVA
jgi:transposase